jgi:glycosyltransferase involved in cell wall biosynthesis
MIKVLHDGVDTDFCKPDENAVFKVKIDDQELEFTAKDEVISYATRGMEAYRGFPEFMKAAAILLKKRPNLHVLVGGEDRVCYGPKLADTTYKQLLMKQLDIDESRVHFIGLVPYDQYIKMLQITSAHVYLTYPFVLSWSLMDAMACAAPIVASNTPPVLEVMQDNYSGLLFDFYNIDQQVEKIEYALDNKDKMKEIRDNARKTMLEKYALKDLLPQHIEYIKQLALKK